MSYLTHLKKTEHSTDSRWIVKKNKNGLIREVKLIYKPSEYYTYFRVLETDDEYFDYYRKRHAHWKMYGLALPDSVLKKVYFENALKIFPKLDKNLFK